MLLSEGGAVGRLASGEVETKWVRSGLTFADWSVFTSIV